MLVSTRMVMWGTWTVMWLQVWSQMKTCKEISTLRPGKYQVGMKQGQTKSATWVVHRTKAHYNIPAKYQQSANRKIIKITHRDKDTNIVYFLKYQLFFRCHAGWRGRWRTSNQLYSSSLWSSRMVFQCSSSPPGCPTSFLLVFLCLSFHQIFLLLPNVIVGFFLWHDQQILLIFFIFWLLIVLWFVLLLRLLHLFSSLSMVFSSFFLKTTSLLSPRISSFARQLSMPHTHRVAPVL